MVIALFGALALSVMTLVLFSLNWFELISQHGLHIFALIGLIMLIAIGFENWHEYLSHFLPRAKAVEWSVHDLGCFIGVVGGALLTFMLSVDFALGPVIAAGLVGILATLVVKRFDVPIYCGAFVGMACSSFLPGYFYLLLAASLAGLFFALTKTVFIGYGGKLGTIAFIGCIGAGLITKRTFLGDPSPSWEVGVYLIGYSILGAILTYVLNVRFKNSPVISSGLIGLTGGIILPVLHLEVGSMYSLMVICASFAGMSNRQQVPNELYLIIIGALCGLVFIYSSPYLGRAGGKLGTIAFGSVIATAGMRRMITRSQVKLVRRRLLLQLSESEEMPLDGY